MRPQRPKQLSLICLTLLISRQLFSPLFVQPTKQGRADNVSSFPVSSRLVRADTTRSSQRLDYALNLQSQLNSRITLKAEQESSATTDLHKELQVQAIGSGPGSFILSMGGTKILVNPNLEGSDLDPATVHEVVDYVMLTSERDEFFHRPTLEKMSLMKVKFVAGDKAGEKLGQLMVRNLISLAPGPDGRCSLSGKREGAADVAVLSAPGASGLPWQRLEQAFVFVNLETGIALGYEALGQYLGAGASSWLSGIPEEAYQVDYLVSPDLREAAGVVKGLTAKGAVIRGVVRLPGNNFSKIKEAGVSPVFQPLLAADRAVDRMLGGVDDEPEEFREFLKQQAAPLNEARLLLPEFGGESVVLET